MLNYLKCYKLVQQQANFFVKEEDELAIFFQDDSNHFSNGFVNPMLDEKRKPSPDVTQTTPHHQTVPLGPLQGNLKSKIDIFPKI